MFKMIVSSLAIYYGVSVQVTAYQIDEAFWVKMLLSTLSLLLYSAGLLIFQLHSSGE